MEGDERVKGGCAGDIDQGQTGYDSSDEEKSIYRKFERRMDLMLSVSATSEAEQATYV